MRKRINRRLFYIIMMITVLYFETACGTNITNADDKADEGNAGQERVSAIPGNTGDEDLVSDSEMISSDKDSDESNSETKRKNTNNKNDKGTNSKEKKNDEKKTDTVSKCSHNWVTGTKVVHHDEVSHSEWVSNNVWIVDEGAWDEAIQTTAVICDACGIYNPSSDHIRNHMLSGDPGAGGTHSDIIVTGYIHHDEKGHFEDQGYYKTVIDKEGYDETVSNGYKCSKCGTVKN